MDRGHPADPQLARLANEQAARALEASGLALWIYTVDTGQVYLNEAWAQFQGEPRAPTLTTLRELYERVPVAQRAAMRLAFVAALKGTRPDYRFEHQMSMPSGNEIWVSSWGRVVQRDASGRALRLMGTYQDITARKRAEAAIAQDIEQLRMAAEGANAYAWVWHIAPDRLDWMVPPEPLLGPRPAGGKYPDFRDMIYEEDRDRALAAGRAAMEALTPDLRVADYHAEFRLVRTDDAVRWLLARGRALADVNGKAIRMSGVTVDIHDRKLAELRLAESEARFKSAFQHSGVGMALVSPEGRWLKVNDALCRLTGYSESELQAMDFLAITHPEDLAADRRQLAERQGRRATEPFVKEKRYLRKDGGVVWVQIHGSVITDEKGERLQTVAQIQDITERKAIEAKTQHLALHDALTGLPNSRLLADRLAQALASARRAKTRVGVLVLDLDRFKPVNDIWGHAAGDAVLKQIAQRLYSAMRQNDTVARPGGDEFVVVATGVTQRREMGRLAKRLLAAIERPCEIEGGTASVSASIGEAIFPEDAEEPEALLRLADTAMYEQKRARCAR